MYMWLAYEKLDLFTVSTVDSPNQACRSLTDAVCEVCTESLTTDAVKLQCGHNFCEDCMKG